MLKTIGRMPAVQNALGLLAANYFASVAATTRSAAEPVLTRAGMPYPQTKRP